MDPGSTKLTVLTDVVSSRSLGTGTAKTQLSGDRSGNANNYTLPAWARSILAVRPFISELTPTAGQAVLASLKVESDDLGIKDFEVYASPLGSVLGATATDLSDPQNWTAYPLNFNCNGGENMQLFGIPQIANTVAPRMGATLWISDQPATGNPVRAKIGGAAGGGASTTSTGTSAARVSGTTITISGGISQPEFGQTGALGRRIKAVYGVVTSGTIVASDVVIGWFEVAAAELAATIRFNMETIQGFLGATGQVWNRISKAESQDVVVQTPTTLTTTLVMDVAPANAGNFGVGVLYQ